MDVCYQDLILDLATRLPDAAYVMVTAELCRVFTVLTQGPQPTVLSDTKSWHCNICIHVAVASFPRSFVVAASATTYDSWQSVSDQPN